MCNTFRNNYSIYRINFIHEIFDKFSYRCKDSFPTKEMMGNNLPPLLNMKYAQCADNKIGRQMSYCLWALSASKTCVLGAQQFSFLHKLPNLQLNIYEFLKFSFHYYSLKLYRINYIYNCNFFSTNTK